LRFVPRTRKLAPLLTAAALVAARSAAAVQFTDVSAGSGANVLNDNVGGWQTEAQKGIGGVAGGDYDNDGWIDLYVVAGDAGSNYLLRNNGDGTFSDVAAAAGVALSGQLSSGPMFGDFNGDGWLDLYVGGIEISPPLMFRNNGDGTFTDVTAAAGLAQTRPTWSATLGDYNNDDHLDLLLSHWKRANQPAGGHLWRNNGDETFTDVGLGAGIVGFANPNDGYDYSLGGNFADIDDDGWDDILWAVDFGSSRIFHNNGDGTFADVTDTTVVTDENAMGTAVADYDHDGDLDYFVTNIYNPPANKTGNRFYRNNGDGTFYDATDETGTRDGLWGWAASFQDFDNDGWLDIFHVNGFISSTYANDNSRLFMSNGDGTFTEGAAAAGAADSSQGRGIVCFDYERDGDVDLYIQNSGYRSVLLRNDGGNAQHWLDVKLTSDGPNTEQIGARIRATAGGVEQTWVLRCGTNYVSQDPAEAHFGLGAATVVDELTVEWTDGQSTTLTAVPADQRLVLAHPGAGPVDAPVADGRPASGGVRFLGAAPNPFGAATGIRYQLARPGPVRVRVHDSAGRRVRILDQPSRPAGDHAVAWDGRDDAGRPVAAGVYWVEVRSGDQSARGKVVRLR
jgi:hypothetical protein